MCLAMIGGIIGANWITGDDNILNHLDEPDEDSIYNSYAVTLIATFGSWVLIFTNFVPVSLMVTLEFVKVI